MPPKVRITREEIVKTAVALVQDNGENAINARAIANALDCSTQPIFSNFSTMKELREAVILSAYERYLGFLKNEVNEGKYPPYKAYGIAYIRFAKEEKELFKLLFMRDRTGEDLSPSLDFEESVAMIMAADGVDHDTAWLIHMELWACVHGIGTMLATSFLNLDEELISTMLSDIYQGIRTRRMREENHNGCN